MWHEKQGQDDQLDDREATRLNFESVELDGSVVKHNLAFCRTLTSLCPPIFVSAANPILSYSPNNCSACNSWSFPRRHFALTPTINECQENSALGEGDPGLKMSNTKDRGEHRPHVSKSLLRLMIRATTYHVSILS